MKRSQKEKLFKNLKDYLLTLVFTMLLPFLTMYYQMRTGQDVCYGFPLCYITTVEIIPMLTYRKFIWSNFLIDFIFWYVIIRITGLIHHRLTGETK